MGKKLILSDKIHEDGSFEVVVRPEFVVSSHRNADGTWFVAETVKVVNAKPGYRTSFNVSGIDIPSFKIPYRMTLMASPTYPGGFTVISCEKAVNSDSGSDVVAYMSCGMFPGIAEKTAKKIYEHFGKETLHVFEEETDRLVEVKGVSKAKVEKIKARLAKQTPEDKELTKFLLRYGFSISRIASVQSFYACDYLSKGENALERLKENPYRLVESVSGIDFDTVDVMREDLGLKLLEPSRIAAAFKQAFTDLLGLGTVRVKLDDVTNKAIRYLRTPDVMDGVVQYLMMTNLFSSHSDFNYEIVKNADGTDAIYVSSYNRKSTEARIADRLAKALRRNIDLPTREKVLDALESIPSMVSFDESQTDAIVSSLTSRFSVLTGGPGTGKSTIIKAICDVYEKLYPGKDIVIMASTGKAACKLGEKTERNGASTIHSRLGIFPGGEYLENNAGVNIRDALVIVDESSMIDNTVMDTLLRCIQDGCQIILVGDADQLRPVGPGNPFEDIISSGCAPVFRLRFCHRIQEEGEGIGENAEFIRTGQPIETIGNFIVSTVRLTEDGEEDLALIEDCVVFAAVEEIKKRGKENVVLLSPVKEGACGVYSLNRRMQEALNPNTEMDAAYSIGNGMSIRAGDPVMHTRNDKETGLVNGDIGICTAVEGNGSSMVLAAQYNTANGVVEKIYDRSECDQVTLAYAFTIHKAQGSEWQSVIMPFFSCFKAVLNRSLLYTGVTRASKHVRIFCDDAAIQKAISNSALEDRGSCLAGMLPRSFDTGATPDHRLVGSFPYFRAVRELAKIFGIDINEIADEVYFSRYNRRKREWLQNEGLDGYEEEFKRDFAREYVIDELKERVDKYLREYPNR